MSLSKHTVTAFARIDLLIALMFLAVIGLLLLASVSTARAKTRALGCMENFRRLSAAWTLYAADNGDKLVMNFHGGEAQGGAAAFNPRYAPWALGWLDWTTGKDNTNIALVTEDRYARLGRYFGRDVRLVKCPEDTFMSPAQRARRWKGRVRSYSMGAAIGDGNAASGPWDAAYVHVQRMTEFQVPGPAASLVFMEEHADSINDPMIYPPNRRSRAWLDLPAANHNGACSVSFADGHVELHRWFSLRAPVRYLSDVLIGVRDDSDLRWVSDRTPRRP